ISSSPLAGTMEAGLKAFASASLRTIIGPRRGQSLAKRPRHLEPTLRHLKPQGNAMSRFVQIHSLTSYPAALLNPDDAGLAKRMPYGGASRIRISSQCLKRHWRL